ncbi:MAG: hypothetical protein WAO74_09145 [Polaribacter sp.]|uniref:hypothetical protein n=1 Tax=Polaribacter sp. TaxID=1920175 RepID=UPI003BB04387
MLKKRLLTLIFLINCLFSFSQERNKLISGAVIDSIGVVKNANIINLNTKQGTFSNDDGLFRIFVSEGDSLSFSSVQHLPKKIFISKKIIENKEIKVLLKSNIYELNEFDLKRHNLQGRLGIDVKDVKRDKRDSLLRNVMDFSNVNFKQKDFTVDEIERVRPPIVNTMEGAMPMIGAGATATIPFKYSERLWALRKNLAQKKEFPYKILSELGDKFFFDELKIPIDNYFHFLEYCNPLGIENLHKNGNVLEVIKILRQESVSYKEIIKNE